MRNGAKMIKGANLQTLFTWGSIDIVVSKIAPMFLACGEGLIMSVQKRRRCRDCCVLYFENKWRSSVLSLFSFSLLMDIQLSMSDKHCLILVILLVNSMSLFVEKKYTIGCHRRKSEIAFRGIVECRPVVLRRVHTESVQGQNLDVHRK